MFSEIRAIRREGVIARNAAIEVSDRFHHKSSASIDSELYHTLAHLEAFQSKYEEYGKRRYKRLVRWMFSHLLIKQAKQQTQEVVSYTSADLTARVNVILFADALQRIRGECPDQEKEWNSELDVIEESYVEAEYAKRDAIIKYSTMIAAHQLTRKKFRHSVPLKAHLMGIEVQYPLLRDELLLLFDKYCPESNLSLPDQLRLDVE